MIQINPKSESSKILNIWWKYRLHDRQRYFWISQTQTLNTYELKMNFPFHESVSSASLKEIDEELIVFESCVVIEFRQWSWIVRLRSAFGFDGNLIWIHSPSKCNPQYRGYKHTWLDCTIDFSTQKKIIDKPSWDMNKWNKIHKILTLIWPLTVFMKFKISNIYSKVIGSLSSWIFGLFLYISSIRCR